MPIENIIDNEKNIPKKNFLARLRNKIIPYTLSLGILAGAYVGCSKDRVSSGDDLESRTKIVFTSWRDGNNEIYIMNSDGSEQKNLTNNSAADGVPYGSPDGSWSPDGTKIAFLSDRNGSFELYIMNSDGSGQKRLTNNSAWDLCPSWSPDGKKIAFNSNRDGNTDVYVMNHDGTGLKRLTNNPAADLYPSWSPFLKTEK